MAFVPNGTIRLLAGVPLDNAYIHTVKFSSASAQATAMIAKTKKVYEHCTYIRETNRIRIPDVYDDVVMCNYLMYQNAGYGSNKWFYAFITGVYYVNDHATEIEFELDVMQTWQFDYDILPCFIERNHTATDVIGENIVEENLNIGEYEVLAVNASDRFSTWDIVMLSTFDPSTWLSTGGGLTGGVYTALNRTVIGTVTISMTGQTPSATFTTDPRPFMTDLINNHADKIDGVISIFMTPHTLEGNQGLTFAINKPTSSTVLLGNYTPKNKKLYTAPYTILYVTNGDGAGKQYNFEDFYTSLSADFKIYTDRAPNQSVVAVPLMYKTPTYQQMDNNALNYGEALVMSGFPECAWISDIYKTYVAQTKAQLTLSTVTAGAQIIGGAVGTVATGGAGIAAGGASIMSGISQISHMLTDLADKKRLAPHVHGTPTGSSFFTIADKTFRAYTLCPKAEYIRIIDDYFDMYGYAIHRVGVPNIDVRPNWCYVKTVDAAIKPKGIDGLPASDMRMIESCLNKGITYWKNMADVGDYTLNNTV